MPQFVVISTTHVPGKKAEAWERFREGGYVAIGWVHEDLTGKPWEEVESIIRSYIRSYKYEKKREKKDMAEAIHAFKVFRDLQPGDYVAAKNVGHGLFGIGVVTSTQRFEHHKHDSGTPNEDEWYSQFLRVEWKRTAYAERNHIVHDGEKSWEPYGAAGKLLDEVPAYIRRALGEEVRGHAQNSAEES